MKKQNVFILTLLILILLYACRKTYWRDEQVQRTAVGRFGIEQARTHIKALVKAEAAFNGKVVTQSSKSQTTIKTGQKMFIPLWDRATQKVYKNKVDYVEVPIVLSHRRVPLYAFTRDNIKQKPDEAVAKAAFQRLVVYRDRKGRIGQRLLTYIPDKQYLMQHGYEFIANELGSLRNDFYGYIEYRNWTGAIVSVVRIEKGKAVRKYKLKKADEKKVLEIKANMATKTMGTNNSSTFGEENCITTCVPVYEYQCWHNEAYPPDEYAPECGDVLVGFDCYEYCWSEPEDPEDPCPWGDCDEEPCEDCESCWNCEEPQEPEPEDGRDSLKKIMKDTCLNAQQVEALAETLSGYLNGQGDADLACIQKTIYNKVLAAGKKFGFCVDSNISGNGSYDPATGNFFWKDESGIPVVGLFGHEFFHGYQDTHYSGGTAQYNTGTQNGFPNIEFEQALFNDIVNGSGGATGMGSTASQAVRDEYRDWIKNITNNNTTYPKQFSDFGGQYYYFLSLFYQNSAYSNMGTVNNSLQPSALLNIFNTSNCK